MFSAVTIPTVQRGTPATLTINLTTLLADSAVTDSYFKDINNVSEVRIIYKSNPGNQFHVVRFDVINSNKSTCNGALNLSARARQNIQIQKISIIDFDGDEFVVGRSSLATQSLDIDAV